MSNALAIIGKQLKSEDVTKRLTLALNLSPDDEKAKTEAYKYALSAYHEIARTVGQEYGDLTKCTPDSLCRAVIDAATFRLAFDGRKLAHIESRFDKAVGSNVATLQIDTNGFVAKIKEHFPDAQFRTFPVYDGDTFHITGTADAQNFEHMQADPFAPITKLKGVVAVISYTDHDKAIRTVHVVPKSDLDAIKSKGKGKAWQEFPLERMQTAALKRSCKWHFRQTVLQDLIRYDNEKNFDMEAQPASPVRSSIIENINQSIEPETIDAEEVKTVTLETLE